MLSLVRLLAPLAARARSASQSAWSRLSTWLIVRVCSAVRAAACAGLGGRDALVSEWFQRCKRGLRSEQMAHRRHGLPGELLPGLSILTGSAAASTLGSLQLLLPGQAGYSWTQTTGA